MQEDTEKALTTAIERLSNYLEVRRTHWTDWATGTVLLACFLAIILGPVRDCTKASTVPPSGMIQLSRDVKIKGIDPSELSSALVGELEQAAIRAAQAEVGAGSTWLTVNNTTRVLVCGAKEPLLLQPIGPATVELDPGRVSGLGTSCLLVVRGLTGSLQIEWARTNATGRPVPAGTGSAAFAVGFTPGSELGQQASLTVTQVWP